jgi:small GTP-binding protein
MQNYNIEKFKLVLIGNSGVGKSSIIQRIIYNMFQFNNPSTIGAAYQTLAFEGKFKIDIWDTAGQERFQSLIPMYLKGADIIFLVLSCESTHEQLLQQKSFWLNFIETHKPYIKEDYKLFLIFNKSDINPDFKIPKEFLEDIQYYYMIITSAKDNKNIENVKLNLEKCCETITQKKYAPLNNNDQSKSYLKFISIPNISFPNSKDIKEYYSNSKCSIL